MSKLEGKQHLILELLVADAAFAGLLARHIEVALPAGALAVVTREALLQMKRAAGRTQDLADIEALERTDGA